MLCLLTSLLNYAIMIIALNNPFPRHKEREITMTREEVLPFVGRWATILRKGATAHTSGHMISVDENSFVFETWPEWSDKGIEETVPLEAIVSIERA